MRLWHYELVRYGLLPKSQLIGLWRELNSIFKKQDKHILINYVYEYPKENLLLYTQYVFEEMCERGLKIKSYTKFNEYFGDCGVSFKDVKNNVNPFPNHHNFRYLLQCYYNLQEKYDRGQTDFDEETFNRLHKYMYERLDYETHKIRKEII